MNISKGVSMSHEGERVLPEVWERKRLERGTAPLMLEVTVRQPCRDCACYTWDREQAHLRFCGITRGEPGLPADLAVFLLEEVLEIPVLVLSPVSCPPETQIRVRVLGALRSAGGMASQESNVPLPLQGWILVAVSTDDPSWADAEGLEDLPDAVISLLKDYVRTYSGEANAAEPRQDTEVQIITCPPQMIVRCIRESRLQLKRQRRMQEIRPGWFSRQGESQPGTWRFVEGLGAELRAALLKGQAATDEEAPYARAEHLIQFVPQRWASALRQVLLEDERLLAFLERPLLHHRAGWLRLEQWRSNAGLFLVTDRQVLWLRDFFSPGSTFLQGGYIVHAVPLERLEGIILLPAGSLSPEQAALCRLLTAQQIPLSSPYQRLVMEVASETGVEVMVVEFPQGEPQTRALERVVKLLQAFLPLPDGRSDRRVRRLSTTEVWQPQPGAEAERLEGLGGIMPETSRKHLEQYLAEELGQSQEEILNSVLIPPLEDYQSPARLVVLTRQAVLVLSEGQTDRSRRKKRKGVQKDDHLIRLRRYPLGTLSSAGLRYSLVGSSLSLTIPQTDQRIERCTLPFHSPAIARFLPLFTRVVSALGSTTLRDPMLRLKGRG
jgi:hypothetical protein